MLGLRNIPISQRLWLILLTSVLMLLVLAGLLNKLIADALGISMRTVEVHRASVFAKMGVRSAVELALLPGSPTQGLRVSSAPERSEGESR